MNLHLIDWTIILSLLITLFFVVNTAKRYSKSVSSFLSANRCAGRYLLAVSEQMSSMGAISFIAMFQMYSQAGFTVIWWENIRAPLSILIALTGFVIYRYRQTRVFTLAEFFERRYSKNFRIFAGFVIFISGILNFAIFPGIGSHFFIYFCGLPKEFALCGVSLQTYPLLMGILLTISLYFTYCSGQLGVMLTDFIQAIFSYIVMLTIVAFIILSVKWSQISEAFVTSPNGTSLINPFKGDAIPDFNVFYFIMFAILAVYQTRAWQGSQGYNCAAISPHEAKMSGILGTFRGYIVNLTILMLPIVTFTFLNHPDFAPIAGKINLALNQIDNEQIKSQMLVPIAMSHFLKTGVLGAFAAVFLAAFISTHDTYLHSWGSIFVQDVVMPFRKKPFSQQQHMRLLRWSILGVAIFAFFFSWAYQPKEAIHLYFQITGAVYLGGAGSVIIGGLYWRKGTTAAAYCSIITGTVLALLGIILREIKPDFFLNSMQISFTITIISICTYILVSLAWPSKSPCNMAKLFNRGNNADNNTIDAPSKGILAKLGVTKEFTLGDKFIYGLAIGLMLVFFSIFLIGTTYNYFIAEIPNQFWLNYWKYYTCAAVLMSIIFTLWMCIGGIFDIKRMFKKLKTTKEDENDDGWVAKPKTESTIANT